MPRGLNKKSRERLSELVEEMKALEEQITRARERLDDLSERHANKLEEWRDVAFRRKRA